LVCPLFQYNSTLMSEFLYGINNGDLFEYNAMVSAIPSPYNDMLTVEGINTEQNDSLSSCMRTSKQVKKLLYSIHVNNFTH